MNSDEYTGETLTHCVGCGLRKWIYYGDDGLCAACVEVEDNETEDEE
jgi:hypothetical protein